MGFVQNVCTSFDLFSKQFIFFIGRNKSKSSFTGRLLSFTVISISVIYLYYLLYLYFNHKMEPKIVISTFVDDSSQEITLEDEFFKFEMLIAGEPLHKVEQRMGKKYLQVYIQYEDWQLDGSNNGMKVDLVECQDKNYEGFLCLNTKQIKPLKLNPISNEMTAYGLYIQPCTGLPVCAPLNEINDFILQAANYFVLSVRTMQYNKGNQSIQSSANTEYYYFDQNLFLFSRLTFVIAEIQVMQGLIVQTTDQYKTIYDYKRSDTTMTPEKLQQKFAASGYGYIILRLDQKRAFVTVQNPMISEVIAQFMSVFNSLFVVGFIARAIAQADIINDVINIMLKNYFKQTAVKLIKKDDERRKKEEDLMKKKNYKNSKIKLKEQQKEIDKKQQIFELNEKIDQTDFIKEDNQLFKIDFSSKLIAFAKKIFRVDDLKKNDDNCYEYKVHEKILNEALQRMNIYQFYTDILRLKMAIKLIFTKQQYAAFLYCGSELICENNNKSKEDNQQQNIYKQNSQDVEINSQNKELQINRLNDQIISNDNLYKCQDQVLVNASQIIEQNIREQQNLKEEEQFNLKSQDKDKSDKRDSLGNSPSNMLLNKPNKNQIMNNMIKSQGDQDTLLIKSVDMEDQSDDAFKNVFRKISNENNNKSYEPNTTNPNKQDNLITRQKQETIYDEFINLEISQKNHLYEMDQIESIPEVREQYCKSFIEQIRKNQRYASNIDLNIFNNLILNEQLVQDYT